MFINCSFGRNAYNRFPCWSLSGIGVKMPDVIFFFLTVFYKALPFFHYFSSEGNTLSGLSEKYTVI